MEPAATDRRAPSQSVFAQTQVANHFGAQHAGDVRGGGNPAARSDFFSNATSADNFATLQNKRRKAFAREIRRRGQSVMPAANNYGVENLGLASAHRILNPG